MSFTLSIPNDTIAKFKCSVCNNSLSYFPISLIKNDKSVCGRCTISERKTRFRNRVFEEIAQFIKFPCRYKELGCNEELFPKEVPSHENNCLLKIVSCPGKEFIECSWRGCRNNILSHCRECHEDVFLEDVAIKFNLDESLYLRKFVEFNGALLTISVMHKPASNKLFYMLYHVEEATKSYDFSYQVMLNKDESNVVAESVATTFSERKWWTMALDSFLKNNTSSTVTAEKTLSEEKNEEIYKDTNKRPNFGEIEFKVSISK